MFIVSWRFNTSATCRLLLSILVINSFFDYIYFRPFPLYCDTTWEQATTPPQPHHPNLSFAVHSYWQIVFNAACPVLHDTLITFLCRFRSAYMFLTRFLWISRDISVSKATGYGMDDRGSILVRFWNFSVRQCVRGPPSPISSGNLELVPKW